MIYYVLVDALLENIVGLINAAYNFDSYSKYNCDKQISQSLY